MPYAFAIERYLSRMARAGMLVLIALLVLAFLVLAITAAMAQTDAHPVPSWVDALMAQLIPYVAVALGTAMTAAVGLLVAYINRWGKKIGVEIDATQAAKLNQALTNAAGGLIQKLGPEAAMKLAPGHPDVVAYAQRVSAGLADALKDLKVDPATVGQRILEKVPQVLPVDSAPVAIAVAPAGPEGPKGDPGKTGPAGKSG